MMSTLDLARRLRTARAELAMSSRATRDQLYWQAVGRSAAVRERQAQCQLADELTVALSQLCPCGGSLEPCSIETGVTECSTCGEQYAVRASELVHVSRCAVCSTYREDDDDECCPPPIERDDYEPDDGWSYADEIYYAGGGR